MLAQNAGPSERSYCRWMSTCISSREGSTPEVRASVGPLLLRKVPYTDRIPACRSFWFAVNEFMREYEEFRV